MMPAIRAEFRKLRTVRSTYVITITVALIIAIISIFPEGHNLSPGQLQDPQQLSGDIASAITAVGIFAGVIAILLMSHEYRYNTIMYTLTASNSRIKVLIAKTIVASAYGMFLAIVVCTLAPFLSVLGVHLAGHSLVAQSIPYGSLVWHCLFVGWGMAMAGLLFALLIRNQMGAIVGLLVTPFVVESFLGVLLKSNVAYLPFHALFGVIELSSQMSPGQAAAVFSCYVAVGWLMALILFLHRDAN